MRIEKYACRKCDVKNPCVFMKNEDSDGCPMKCPCAMDNISAEWKLVHVESNNMTLTVSGETKDMKIEIIDKMFE